MIRDGHLGGYFEGGDARSEVPRVWSWLLHELDAYTVLDIGCATGHGCMEYFASCGLRVLGVEGCDQAIRDHLFPDRVVRHDFTAGPWSPGCPFHLVWCSEFLEHVEERFLPNVLPAFFGHVLAITAAVPGQNGHHHVNEQPHGYWIRVFESLGYTYDRGLASYARKLAQPLAGEVDTHFAHNGLIFTF